MIPPLQSVTTVGVWGPVSSGKSWLIEQWIRSMGRVLIDDVTGATIGDESLTHFWQRPRDMANFLAANPNYFRVAYHPGGDVEYDFRWAFHCAWSLDAPRWLIVDELWQVAPNVKDGMTDEMNLVCRMARHVKLGFIGASQRVADVSTVYRSATRMNVFFWMEQGRDLDAISDTWGDAARDTVAALRPCLYDDATATVRQAPECLVVQRGREPVIYDLSSQPIENEASENDENALDNNNPTEDNTGHVESDDASQVE